MKSEPHSPRLRINRMAQGDPLQRLVERAYRAYDRPAPRHLSGCRCALCADRAQARALANRGARDWTAEEVRGWFERVSGGEPARNGLKVASRTDRAVFRFLLPRVLELLAAGSLAADATTVKVFAQFEPGRLAPGGTSPDAIMPRFAGLLLDRALQDPDWPVDLIATLRLLASGGWPLPRLVQQAQNDPDLPASLARAWSRTHRGEPPFLGTWPAGAVSVLRSTFLTPLLAERMMNYAMAEGTSACETDDAMRAADLLLRNL
jgi:hypothetical protein